VGLPQGGLLLLHLPVVVQQARLAGAGLAVAGVEHAWLVVMLPQHGCLRSCWPGSAGGGRRGGVAARAVNGVVMAAEAP